MSRIPVIIDTDPGHDDAFAIMMALASDKLEVKAITTVCGNSTVENTTKNALNILSLFDRTDIPVAMGRGDPMLGKLDRNGGKRVHGESGLEGPVFPPLQAKPVDMNAVDLIAKVVKESEQKVVLAPLGPLCNIAAFVLSYPELLDRIEMISMMGGNTFWGNVTPGAEYNIYVDPESAQVVFQSGIPIVMHSINSVHLGKVSDKDIEQWRSFHNKAGKFADEMMEIYTIYPKKIGSKFYRICDAHAIAYLIDPSIFTTVLTHVEVDLCGQFTRGRTVADLRDKATKKLNGAADTPDNCHVVTDVDSDRFVALLTESIRTLG